jgi:hypothetical protein
MPDILYVDPPSESRSEPSSPGAIRAAPYASSYRIVEETAALLGASLHEARPSPSPLTVMVVPSLNFTMKPSPRVSYATGTAFRSLPPASRSDSG